MSVMPIFSSEHTCGKHVNIGFAYYLTHAILIEKERVKVLPSGLLIENIK